MTAPGISSQMEACLWNASDAAMDRTLVRLNLVGLKDRCRGICVVLQNRFLDPPGDCGWHNVSFMPWFERRKQEVLVLPPRHGPF